MGFPELKMGEVFFFLISLTLPRIGLFAWFEKRFAKIGGLICLASSNPTLEGEKGLRWREGISTLYLEMTVLTLEFLRGFRTALSENSAHLVTYLLFGHRVRTRGRRLARLADCCRHAPERTWDIPNTPYNP